MSQLLTIGISVCVLLLAGMVADRLLADKVAWQDLVWRLTLLSVLILPLFLIFANSKWPVGLVQIPVLTARPHVALEASLESNDQSDHAESTTETSRAGLISRQQPVQSHALAAPTYQAQRIDAPNAVDESAGTKGASDVIASGSFATSMPIKSNIPWLFFVKTTWVLGSAYCLIRYIIGLVTIQMIAARARIANKTEPQGWSKAIDQATLAAGLKSRITVRPSSSISTPMLIGVICPIILVPESMLKLSPSDARVQAALTHEAMHIRRADTFWNILLFASILIWWPIPVVHWMKKRMFWLRELLCDANAATEMGVANYAESLLQLTQRPCKRQFGLLATPLHSQKQSLESRVAWILDKSNFVPKPSRMFRRIAWSFLLVAILGFSTIKLVPVNAQLVPANRQIVDSADVAFATKAMFRKLPSEFSVHAVGTYKGMAVLDDVVLDDTAHKVRQAEVIVNKPGENIVLVLSAYDPVVWRVGRTEKTKIVGVIVSGYHGQAVIGLGKKIPIAVATHDDKEFPFFQAYKASPAIFTMNRIVKTIVGKEVEQLYIKPKNKIFYVGTVPETTQQDDHYGDERSAPTKPKIYYSDERSAQEILAERDPKYVQPRKTLKDLVEAGKLRLATQAEIVAWVDKASEKYRHLNANLRVSHYMRVGRTYVVDSKITLPNGMFGAHSRSFIIAKDAPLPDGDKGHNSFYLMKYGTEQGPHAAR